MSKETLSVEEINRIAKLAHITLTVKEITLFAGQLSEIISYFEMINQIVLPKNTPEFGSVITKTSVYQNLRTVPQSLVSVEAIKNAPATDDVYIKTKTVIQK